MHLAFITDSNHIDYVDDDKLLVNFLLSKGYTISPVVWDDPAVTWSAYNLLIIRSTWDYYLKIDAFSSWLDLVEQLRIPIFNPIPVIRWNKDKNYFLHFRSLGIPIQPFEYCHQGIRQSLTDILKRNEWTKAVIKPSISLGANNTFSVDLSNCNDYQPVFDDLIRHQSMIIQKFSSEIITSGELSLIYFNKQFSHAVCKKVKPGDFRVQARFGGQHQSYTPDQYLLMQTDKILALIPESLLYARVDGFLDEKDQFQLMELELLEPSLFFDSNSQATENFCIAMQNLIEQGLNPL